MRALILAGGLGTRIRAIFGGTPKAMVPVGNHPFIYYLLENLKKKGFNRFYFALGYGSDEIYSYVSKKYPDSRFSFENKQLGTGGAVKKALFELNDEITYPLFIINGDTLVNTNFCRFYSKASGIDSPLCVGILEVEDVSRYGAVEVRDGKIIQFNEKGMSGSGYINSGVYLAQKRIQDYLPESERFSIESDVFPAMLTDGLAYYNMGKTDFIDIGTPESFRRFEAMVKENKLWF